MPPVTQQPRQQEDVPDVVRERVCDQYPEHFDPITGEHYAPSARALMGRENADQWVAGVLLARRGT